MSFYYYHIGKIVKSNSIVEIRKKALADLEKAGYPYFRMKIYDSPHSDDEIGVVDRLHKRWYPANNEKIESYDLKKDGTLGIGYTW